MRMIFTAAAAAVFTLTGCADGEPTMVPATEGPVAAIPADGVEAGLRYAPPGFSLPAEASVVETIDQVNNITLVFSTPLGSELADYYRRALPELGFTITDDTADTLLFESDQWRGAVTSSEEIGAITLRTDWEDGD